MADQHPALAEAVRSSARRRWRLALLCQGIIGAFVVITLIVFVIALFYLAFGVLLFLVTREGDGLKEILFGILGKTIFAATLLISVLFYLMFFWVPFVLVLPIAVPLIALWRRPPVILVFRSFNRGPRARPLERFLWNHVVRYGHAYTLADKDIHIRWYAWIPIILGQLSVFWFRIRRIRNEVDLDRLARGIDRRWMRSLNWCMGRRKIFPVACTDDVWQACVERLIPRADLILVDVTGSRSNVRWEVETLHELDADQRAIFLTKEDSQQEAREFLDAIERGLGDRLFTYEGSNTRRLAAETARLLAPHGLELPSPVRRGSIWAGSFLVSTGVVIGSQYYNPAMILFEVTRLVVDPIVKLI